MMQSKVFLIEPDTYYRVKFQYEGYDPYWRLCQSIGATLYEYGDEVGIDWGAVVSIQPVFRMDEATGKFSRLNADLIIESQNA